MHCCGMLLGVNNWQQESGLSFHPVGFAANAFPIQPSHQPKGSLLLALHGYCFSFHFQEQRPCETKGIPKVAQRLDFNSYMTSLHPTTLYCHQNSVPYPTQSKALRRLSRECTNQIGKTNELTLFRLTAFLPKS